MIEKSFSYDMSFVILAAIGAYLLALTAYLVYKAEHLDTDGVKQRVGEIYNGYVVHRAAKPTIAFLFCSASRRVALGLVITFGEGNALAQFLTIYFSSLLLIAILGAYRPLESSKAHIIEIGNEYLIVILFNHFLCHTDLVQDLEVRYIIGWQIIAIISLSVVINFGLVLRDQIVALIRQIKLRKLRAAHQRQKAIQLREAENAK